MNKLAYLSGHAAALVAIYCYFVGFCSYAERLLSKSAKTELAKYLRSSDFPQLPKLLPIALKKIFEGVFGERHLSIRCACTSMLFSISAIAILLVIGFVNHYDYFRTMPEYFSTHPSFRFSYLSWILISVLPDYLSLLKTRVVINTLHHRSIDAHINIFLFVADLIFSYLIFCIFFQFLFYVDMMYQVAMLRSIPLYSLLLHNFHIYFYNLFRNGFIVHFHQIIKGPTDNEISVLFYAGILPSIWLWLYLFSAFLSRLALRSARIVVFFVSVLDISRHPLRAVGFIAATLTAAGYACVIVLTSILE